MSIFWDFFRIGFIGETSGFDPLPNFPYQFDSAGLTTAVWHKEHKEHTHRFKVDNAAVIKYKVAFRRYWVLRVCNSLFLIQTLM